jgi:hypothetical protein
MVNIEALQAALNKEFQEPLQDFVIRSNPLLASLPKRSLATDKIWLRHKTGSAHNPRPILDGADVTVGNPASTFSAGSLEWATYISEFSVPKRLLGQVQRNPAAIGQIFQTEVQDAAADLADRLAADIFGGVTANGLVGMQTVFSNTGTYATIDRASAANAYWRGLEVDAAAADLSTSLFYDAQELWFATNKNQLFTPQNSPVGITSQRLLRKYQEMFEQISYDALPQSHFVNQANASGFFGRSGVGFSGAPLIADPNISSAGDTADTDRIYLLNPDSVFLASLSPNDDPEVVRMQQLDASKAPTAENLALQIEILGNAGERVTGYVKTYVQLVCDAPNKAGVVIKNVSRTL